MMNFAKKSTETVHFCGIVGFGQIIETSILIDKRTKIEKITKNDEISKKIDRNRTFLWNCGFWANYISLNLNS
jgi:hypothetical protein